MKKGIIPVFIATSSDLDSIPVEIMEMLKSLGVNTKQQPEKSKEGEYACILVEPDDKECIIFHQGTYAECEAVRKISLKMACGPECYIHYIKTVPIEELEDLRCQNIDDVIGDDLIEVPDSAEMEKKAVVEFSQTIEKQLQLNVLFCGNEDQVNEWIHTNQICMDNRSVLSFETIDNICLSANICVIYN